MTAVREELDKLRAVAEQCIEPVIKAFDRENALRPRDDILAFRRRFRLFAHTPGEPYLTHMRYTVKQMPDYVKYMVDHADKFSQPEVARMKRLEQALTAMVKLADESIFPFTAAP